MADIFEDGDPDAEFQLWELYNSEVINRLKEMGFDSLVMGEDYRPTYAVFSPNQIKSVYNRGTWSKEDDRILYQDGGPSPKSVEYGRRVEAAYREWSKEVDGFLAGKKNPREILQMGPTPGLLQEIGAPDLPLVVDQSTLKKVMGVKRSKRGTLHNLTADQVKKIYVHLADPVAVIKSYGNSHVVLTALVEDGKPLVIPIHLDTEKGGLTLHKVASVHKRDGGWGWVKGQILQGRLRFYSKRKAASSKLSARLQLPQAFATYGKSKILTDKDVVKPFFEDRSLYADGQVMFQEKRFAPPRGAMVKEGGQYVIYLFERADKSTLPHEIGHVFRQVLEELALDEATPQWCKDDWVKACSFVGAKVGKEWSRKQEEKWARAFEQYLFEGKVPSEELRSVFQTFRRWMLAIYHKVLGLGIKLDPEIEGVFQRMLATEAEIEDAFPAYVSGDKLKYECLGKRKRHIEISEGAQVARSLEQTAMAPDPNPREVSQAAYGVLPTAQY